VERGLAVKRDTEQNKSGRGGRTKRAAGIELFKKKKRGDRVATNPKNGGGLRRENSQGGWRCALVGRRGKKNRQRRGKKVAGH